MKTKKNPAPPEVEAEAGGVAGSDAGRRGRAATAGKRGGRTGRPPASASGEVDSRILDAATAVFLEKGFDGTSFDEIAARAGAGKASIYARYPAKDLLLAAVVRLSVEDILVLSASAPGAPLAAARLGQVGIGMIEHTLEDDAIALMRLVIAEGGRFPELARHTHRMARESATALIADAIRGAPGRSGDATREARIAEAADLFLEIVFMPFAMRALFGDEPQHLMADAKTRVALAIRLVASMDVGVTA